jgi:hypothetical protein
MLKQIFLIFILTQVSLSAVVHAGNISFEPIYTDAANRLQWGKMLTGTYSNGCAGANGLYDYGKCTVEKGADGNLQVKVADSNAAKACRDMGARLPTKPEFESLIRQFDHFEKSDGPGLTESGVAGVKKVFGERLASWSSSATPYNAYYFEFGVIWLSQYRYDPSGKVRCVVGP